MATDTHSAVSAELSVAIDRLRAGKPNDPAQAREALARLSAEREALRKKIGTIDVAVELVRDARNQ